MTEDIRQKEKRLQQELAKVRAAKAAQDRNIVKERNYDLAGIDSRTSHKATHGNADVPDVVLLPKRKRRASENIPW